MNSTPPAHRLFLYAASHDMPTAFWIDLFEAHPDVRLTEAERPFFWDGLISYLLPVLRNASKQDDSSNPVYAHVWDSMERLATPFLDVAEAHPALRKHVMDCLNSLDSFPIPSDSFFPFRTFAKTVLYARWLQDDRVLSWCAEHYRTAPVSRLSDFPDGFLHEHPLRHLVKTNRLDDLRIVLPRCGIDLNGAFGGPPRRLFEFTTNRLTLQFLRSFGLDLSAPLFPIPARPGGIKHSPAFPPVCSYHKILPIPQSHAPGLVEARILSVAKTKLKHCEADVAFSVQQLSELNLLSPYAHACLAALSNTPSTFPSHLWAVEPEFTFTNFKSLHPLRILFKRRHHETYSAEEAASLFDMIGPSLSTLHHDKPLWFWLALDSLSLEHEFSHPHKPETSDTQSLSTHFLALPWLRERMQQTRFFDFVASAPEMCFSLPLRAQEFVNVVCSSTTTNSHSASLNPWYEAHPLHLQRPFDLLKSQPATCALWRSFLSNLHVPKATDDFLQSTSREDASLVLNVMSHFAQSHRLIGAKLFRSVFLHAGPCATLSVDQLRNGLDLDESESALRQCEQLLLTARSMTTAVSGEELAATSRKRAL